MASIVHRITGVLLFLSVPILLLALGYSLDSPQGFDLVVSVASGFFGKFVLWAIVSFFIYHLVAGIKHLFMDMGKAETLEGAEIAFYLTVGVSGILIIFAGIWIW